VKKWINAYGDPRSPHVDPVDWVERIPFNETRNYVQRVMENLLVYRNRLADRSAGLSEGDLPPAKTVR
jgi:soluble lytic murein transglycosylase